MSPVAGKTTDGTLVQRCETRPRQHLLFLGSSVPQHVQVVNAILVQPGSCSNVDEAEEDWPEEWCHDWDSDWADDLYGNSWWTAPEEQPSEWHEEEEFLLWCVESLVSSPQ